MGKVEKFVKKREQEKHITTEEFMGLTRWYIEECNKLDVQWASDKNNLNEAFKSRLAELKAKEVENNGK